MAPNKYNNAPESYLGGQSATLAKKETLQTTLVETGQCLGEIQAMLMQVKNKIHGDTPRVDEAKGEVPIGIAGMAMDLRNRAQQIRSLLEIISSDLA